MSIVDGWGWGLNEFILSKEILKKVMLSDYWDNYYSDLHDHVNGEFLDIIDWAFSSRNGHGCNISFESSLCSIICTQLASIEIMSSPPALYSCWS